MKATLSTDQAGHEILVLEVPLAENKSSRSGTSTIIATSHGQQFIGKVRGKDTYLQLNVMQIESAGGGLQIVNNTDGKGDMPTLVGEETADNGRARRRA